MHVTCPNCTTKYNLPEEMFKQGAKARCTVCKHVFALAEAKDAAKPQAPETKPLNVAVGDSLDDILGGDVSFAIDEGKGKKKEKKSKKALIVLLVLLLLVGGAGGAAYFFLPEIMSMLDSEPPPPQQQEEAVASDHIKNLALRNVRQYYKENERIGNIVVVEGQIQNNFEVPKELIKVEVSLYNSSGVAVATKQQYCGISVSHFQLQVLGEQELEAALNNKVEILTNNTNIMPNQVVPFMVVFYNPPQDVKEYAVKVVEAKEPPKDNEKGK